MYVSYTNFLSLAVCCLLFDECLASGRTFRAAPKNVDLRRRSNDCSPKSHDHELVFVDDLDPSMAAIAAFDTARPMLDIDHAISDIKRTACSTESIEIELHERSKAKEAVNAWLLEDSFVVSTHHAHCSVGDEHTTWSVRDPILIDNHTIVLNASRVALRDLVRNVNVEFGEHLAHRVDRNRDRLSRRQDDSPIGTASVSPTVTFASATATATGLSASGSISTSHQNEILIPPPGIFADVVATTPYMVLECIDCSVSGDIKVTAGSVNVSSCHYGWTEADEVCDFFESGWFDFEATNLGAHMEFGLDFLPGFTIASTTPRLPEIPIGAISLAGLVTFGPVLELGFPLGVTLQSSVNLTAGFELTAPPSVAIHLDVGNMSNSNTSGFRETGLKALPFTADADGLALDFYIGFQPQLHLKAGVGANETISASGDISLSLDLPMLNANLAPVVDSNPNCSTTKNETLYLFSPVVSYGGISSTANIDIDLDIETWNWADSVPIFNGWNVSLEDQCLAYDAKTGILATLVHDAKDSGQSGLYPSFDLGLAALAGIFVFAFLS